MDDSIVVVENIYRHIHQGESFPEAAIKGTKEVVSAITSATMVTVAVFLPLAFLGGLVGNLFTPFSLTLTFALLASLLVALMVVPSLSSPFRSRKLDAKRDNAWYQQYYVNLMKWALRHRAITLAIAGGLFLSNILLLSLVSTSLLPAVTEKLVLVDIRMPTTSDLTATSPKTIQVEEAIEANLEWRVYHTTIGMPNSVDSNLGALLVKGNNTARIFVLLNPEAELEREADKLRRASKVIAEDSAICVYAGMLPEATAGTTLRFRIYGEKHQDIAEAANKITALLRDIEGIANVSSGAAAINPEISIDVNPIRLCITGYPQLKWEQNYTRG